MIKTTKTIFPISPLAYLTTVKTYRSVAQFYVAESLKLKVCYPKASVLYFVQAAKVNFQTRLLPFPPFFADIVGYLPKYNWGSEGTFSCPGRSYARSKLGMRRLADHRRADEFGRSS
jgi:hypothetical protein